MNEFLKGHIKQEYQEEIDKEIVYSNNRRCQFVLLILIIPMSLYVSWKFIFFNQQMYLNLLFIFIGLIGLSLLHFQKNKRYIGAVHIFFMIVCLIWAQYTNFEGYQVSPNYTPYIIALMGLATIAYLKPKYSIILFGVNHIVFLLINAYLVHDNVIIVEITVNSTIAMVFAFIFSLLNYKARLQLFQNKKLVEELNLANQKLIEYVHTDVGTGINNRLAFSETLEHEWHSAMLSKEMISLIMIDIDYFKQYNDTYGHSKGDVCLREVAQCINQYMLSTSAFVGRYGGEEFVVVLPKTDKVEALKIAENIRTQVIILQIPHLGRDDNMDILTVSLGVASITPENADTSIRLLELADKALYRAKAEGRNRVV
ncbi:GGDEF domain-containing protein [Anaerocolumna sp. AGMB13020]|uniref:GGDEF domain-containing protein n=1 Tax=Anaerocolumna sp. AGMB13020 TaxID=3081750 RepID=UPI002952A760|nr:GGDEF domain-containing protein [Anaerocolumna sp. AGMB13020]WOO37983.1 GGDEF domain-containing protein [Anaerocolumna sp. AGMB13020]